ncbi:MAG: hypothetical protein QW171_01920 [Candidatus Bilamarchaeaceae archaeon]
MNNRILPRRHRCLAHFKEGIKRVTNRVCWAALLPLLSLSVFSHDGLATKKTAEKPVASKIIKKNEEKGKNKKEERKVKLENASKASKNILRGRWSAGECIFNESDWSLTYKSTEEIYDQVEATIKLDTPERVGSPDTIFCGDYRTYLLTPTEVLITLGGYRVFAGHDMLGVFGGSFQPVNLYGLGFTQVSERGILLKHVVFNVIKLVADIGLVYRVISNDKLYLFTMKGELFELPLEPPTAATCIAIAEEPVKPKMKAAITQYKGLVVLAKEGKENIILVETTEGKWKTKRYKSDKLVTGDVSMEEKDGFLEVRIGKKAFSIKVAEEGNTETAVIEEKNAYKEKKDDKKG